MKTTLLHPQMARQEGDADGDSDKKKIVNKNTFWYLRFYPHMLKGLT